MSRLRIEGFTEYSPPEAFGNVHGRLDVSSNLNQFRAARTSGGDRSPLHQRTLHNNLVTVTMVVG